MTAAASTSARLPNRWPWVSLTLLNPSRSMNSSDSGRPLREARLVSLPEHQIQIARVVEMRQVVGDRQLFGPLQQQRVVEGDRRRLEQDADRAQDRRRHPRLARRRGAVEADERADAAAAAAERKGEDRSDRGVLHARVGAQVGGRRIPRPRCITQLRDAVDGWPHVGRQAAIRQHRRLPRQIGRRRRPSTAPAPTWRRVRR